LKMIKVELSAMGLVATFDGQAANIEILHVDQNEQCGLCGHLSPDHRVTDDMREQYEQYILKGGNNCRQTADHPNSDFAYKPYWEPTDETTSDQERLTGDEPRLKQKLIETQDQICISIDTVPQCPANTYSMDKVEKRVPYHCLKLDDGRAWEYRSKIQYGETVRLDDVTPTMTRTEYVPIKCEPIH